MTASTLGHALDVYRRTGTSRSALALLIANSIPLIGVLFFGWSLLTILVLFWIENGIVGLWNIPRILLAQGSVLQSLPVMPEEAAFSATGNARAAADLRARWEQARQGAATAESASQLPVNPMASILLGTGGFGRAMMAVWFVVHYGIFWIGHGIFVFALPSFLSFGSRTSCTGLPAFPDLPLDSATCASSPFGEVNWSNVTIAAAALFLSHGASFFLNYIGKREYLTTSAMRQMFAPYGRVVVLHLTILFGAFAIAIIGAPIGALVVLVVVKTLFDLNLHLRSQRAVPPGAPVLSAAS